MIPPCLKGFAADILNRVAHNLFILKLGSKPTDTDSFGTLFLNDPAEIRENELHALAFECVRLASDFDIGNTLICSKILSISQSRKIDFSKIRLDGKLWPFGGGNFDRFARMYEYLLLWETIPELKRKESCDTTRSTMSKMVVNQIGTEHSTQADAALRDEEQNLAKYLLVNFLTQTDSSNVRLSSVYKYLTKDRRKGPRFKVGQNKLRLEFVCLRRYSSFFPFLPRPSSFRSIGGGYLIRLYGEDYHSQENNRYPFGIAIDPGSDFLENLYRAGYSVADIDMIIVTHDHADHIASLDPLLSLLGYRDKIDETKFGRTKNRPSKANRKPLLILGNDSVVMRYSFFNEFEKEDTRHEKVHVFSISQWKEIVQNHKDMLPDHIITDLKLDIRGYKSRHEDAAGNDGCSLRISIGGEAGPSLGITGDTDLPFHIKENSQFQAGDASMKRYEDEVVGWNQLIDSDVLIAHLSSVPLNQLRQFSRISSDSVNAKWLQSIWSTIDTADSRLSKQIRFAFWLGQSKNTNLFDEVGRTDKPIDKHLYLDGIIKLARKFREQVISSRRDGLFIVSELREELGTFRDKVAAGINKYIFTTQKYQTESLTEAGKCMAFTADLDFSFLIESMESGKKMIRVLCSTCAVDGDCTPEERYHIPFEIKEVCVKGEDEGMFYNCRSHDPGGEKGDSYFVERMERYDPFSRYSIPQ